MPQTRNIKLLKNIALRIKELREKRALTQEDVYNDTGINVGRIERAINDPSISSLERICKYFDISLSEFFKGIK
jgi:transcriptional regulator with XRE-family HTH domain